MFNNRKVVGGKESWGWSINIKDYFDGNSGAELLNCGIYVGGDSGSCRAGSGVRVGTVEIKKDYVTFLLNPGSEASSFQLYAGKCEGSDFGGHIMNGDDDSSCDSSVVQRHARRPESYPLSATLESSATNFKFTADNQQDYMKPDPWGNSEYDVFKLSGQDYLSIHADICTTARAGSYSSSSSGSGVRSGDRSLQALDNANTFRQSWPTNRMPQGPTYYASSSASRFPTTSPTSVRSVPLMKIPTATSSIPSSRPATLPTSTSTPTRPQGPTYRASSSASRFPTLTPTSPQSEPPARPRSEPLIKIPTAAPSSLPSYEPSTPPTTAPSKFRPSWPTNLMPQGPTYRASSSASRFPTSTPTSPQSVPPARPRSEPVIKIPSAAPSSLPFIEPNTPPTIAPTECKFPTSWPTDLPTSLICDSNQ
jgi:hypothetical protein